MNSGLLGFPKKPNRWRDLRGGYSKAAARRPYIFDHFDNGYLDPGWYLGGHGSQTVPTLLSFIDSALLIAGGTINHRLPGTAVPFRLRCGFSQINRGSTYDGVTIGFGSTVANKDYGNTFSTEGSLAGQRFGFYRNSPIGAYASTVFDASTEIVGRSGGGFLQHMQMRFDGTTVFFDLGVEGQSFTVWTTEALTTHFGAGNYPNFIYITGAAGNPPSLIDYVSVELTSAQN